MEHHVVLQTHTHALKRGSRLRQYEIEGVLGSGGFGITYLARDTGLDAPVAIKEYLPSELAVRQGDSRVSAVSTTVENDFKWGLDRFLEEARVLAKFRHPNIVNIFQVFETNDTAYIVMEYAEGESLSDLIQRSGSLSERATREILLPILDGLRCVHERGFLHRDIKPGNIILRDKGGPALIDFGAARQAIETKSRSITSIVTEGYAPLEQYDPNGNQGPWTDIYALGAVAYKCLTGKTPPASTSRVRNDPYVPPGTATGGAVSLEFDSAVSWALAVYEEDRPQSIDEFTNVITGQSQPRSLDHAETTRLLRPVSKPGGGGAAESTQLWSRDVAQSPSFRPSGLEQNQTGFDAKRVAIVIVGTLAVLAAVFGGLRMLSRTAPEVPVQPSPAKAAAPIAASYPEQLQGPARVIDTGTLSVGGHNVVLAGIIGLNGQYARNFQETVSEFGSVSCAVIDRGPLYHCSVRMPNGYADLSDVALVNGAARTNGSATDDQRKSEFQAQTGRRGVWANWGDPR